MDRRGKCLLIAVSVALAADSVAPATTVQSESSSSGGVVTHQLWGPLINLVGDGGFRAWAIGEWFLMKFANLVQLIVIAVLFLAAMFINLPEEKPRSK